MDLLSQTQDVVLFDGECNFCRSQIGILQRLDSRKRLRFVSLHDQEAADDYPDLTREELMAQMWVVNRQGLRCGGAFAVRYLSTKLPILWPLVPLMYLPGAMPLWQYLYHQIAKRRYAIAGRNCDGGTCSLHYPAAKAGTQTLPVATQTVPSKTQP